VFIIQLPMTFVVLYPSPFFIFGGNYGIKLNSPVAMFCFTLGDGCAVTAKGYILPGEP